MSSQLKKRIVEALERVGFEDDSQQKYKTILQFVKEQNINTTRNKRGYWFDLTPLPESTTRDLYNIILKQFEK